MTKTFRLLSALAFASVVTAPTLRAQWTAPTPEELSMTSIPEVPGAPAVYLWKEQLADDAQHMQSFYVRLKVLTEGGKEYANVELPFVSGDAGRNIDSISGRTIHPDGTVIPFTGKPYEKIVEKVKDYKIKVKIFTLPSVEVGSIIEYRYKVHIDDHYFAEPDWTIQTALFTRKAHYMWRPTDRELSTSDGKQLTTHVAWTPILPPGAAVKESAVQMRNGVDGGHAQLDLDVHDIMPVPKEEYMPPMASLSYKVLFYYTSYRTTREFWTSEGKEWSKTRNKFMDPGSAVRAAVKELAPPSDTQEQKLRKIYAAVMALENTDYTREHSSSEERAQGLKEIRTVDEVLNRKRGTSDQLTALFVSMARVAGFKAYLMGVANRNERIFLPNFLSTYQLDDDIAIVNLDGKDVFFDPGERYCSFGLLSWRHAYSAGLRQTDSGVDLANTPSQNYKESHVSRIADLKLDDTGVATGTIRVEYTGDSALAWRQDALRGDETSLKTNLRVKMEHMLPANMEVKVTKMENVTNYEQPLKVSYEINGPIGSTTGKRLLVPGNLFEMNAKPLFHEPKRELAVDMQYPSFVQDAVRFILPASLVIESAPAAVKEMMSTLAAFQTNSVTAPNSITLYRNLQLGTPIFSSNEYPELHSFYTRLEARDQETLVLTRPANKTGGEN